MYSLDYWVLKTLVEPSLHIGIRCQISLHESNIGTHFVEDLDVSQRQVASSDVVIIPNPCINLLISVEGSLTILGLLFLAGCWASEELGNDHHMSDPCY